MEKFSIKFTDEFFDDNNEYAVGEIEIGNFSECFHASLTYWSKEKYLSQWQQAFTRILNGFVNTVLITSMYDPKIANFIFCWELYLDGDLLHIQNRVLFLDQLNCEFNEDSLYDFISERKIVNEDGEKISEWDTTLEAITNFIEFDPQFKFVPRKG